MQESKDNASREGDLVIQEAQLKARGILEECRVRTEELRREIVGLRKEKETYLARFKGLAEAQINFIETHKDDFSDLDQRLIDMVDSVVGGQVEKLDAVPTTTVKVSETNTDDQWRDYDTCTNESVSSTAASVDMAAMGIPVPAIDPVIETDNIPSTTPEVVETATT